MLFTCAPLLVLRPVPVATELEVGLLDVPPVEDAVGVGLGINVTPFIIASVAIASPILIQSSYEQSAFAILTRISKHNNAYQDEIWIPLVQTQAEICLSRD